MCQCVNRLWTTAIIHFFQKFCKPNSQINGKKRSTDESKPSIQQKAMHVFEVATNIFSYKVNIGGLSLSLSLSLCFHQVTICMWTAQWVSWVTHPS